VFDRTIEPVSVTSSSIGRAVGIALGAAIVVALVGADGTSAEAQTAPAQTAQAPAAQAAAQKPGATPAPPSVLAYTYEAGGRRDPFIGLDRASDPKGSARSKVSGLASLSINEATVKGVVKSQGRLVAMVQAPDNKTYIVRPNDRLLDGAVRAVTPEAVVFVQHVNDPLSLVKQREIRKPLRIIEEDK